MQILRLSQVKPHHKTILYARQIAKLLNKNNKLYYKYTSDEILSSFRAYIVVLDQETLVGAAELRKLSWSLSELRHIVVHPSYRRIGVGFLLVTYALLHSSTPLVYATVRHDNIASSSLLRKCSFRRVANYTTERREVGLYIATAIRWKTNTTHVYVDIIKEAIRYYDRFRRHHWQRQDKNTVADSQ